MEDLNKNQITLVMCLFCTSIKAIYNIYVRNLTVDSLSVAYMKILQANVRAKRILYYRKKMNIVV